MYTIIFIAFMFLVFAVIGGVLYFIMWIDKKIDMKNRMGYSAYLKKSKNSEQQEDSKRDK